MKENIKIGLADDHVLLRNGLAILIRNLGYSVILECSNGKEVMAGIDKDNLPDIMLMDINMPDMDGFETTLWLKENHPSVRVLALSMYKDELAIIRMLKNGAKGYILKEGDPRDLQSAITSLMQKGFHYSELVTGSLIHAMDDNEGLQGGVRINSKEIEFLKLASTEMTYKQIADQMALSPRTIDGYRESLFEKLNIKSRVGLVLYAIRNRIVQVK
ncbi:MAG: response regulator transcription factor [Chitinophagaceae bacterium]|nr:response regulator transcription factor [Chitinophagaceae bacterium]